MHAILVCPWTAAMYARADSQQQQAATHLMSDWTYRGVSGRSLGGDYSAAARSRPCPTVAGSPRRGARGISQVVFFPKLRHGTEYIQQLLLVQ